MKTTQLRSWVSIAMCGLMLTTSIGAAQQHVLDRSTMEELLASRLADEDAQREHIRRVLAHPEVTRVAAQTGIDMTRLTEGVATLDGEELADVAARALEVDSALSGGQSTITFSTTTVIIVLLVLILIIVAVN